MKNSDEAKMLVSSTKDAFKSNNKNDSHFIWHQNNYVLYQNYLAQNIFWKDEIVANLKLWSDTKLLTFFVKNCSEEIFKKIEKWLQSFVLVL